MQILMIVLNQTGRGTYWRAYQLARQLSFRNHKVTLMSMAPRARLHLKERDVDGVRLVETPDLLSGSLRSGWDPWDTLRRVWWARGRRFDVVHAFETRPIVIYPALAAHSQGARLALDWCDWFGRGGSVEERPNPFIRAILRPLETYFENHFRTRACGTTVINSILRDRAIGMGVPPESILLLRNGSDTQFQPMPALDARRALGLPETGNMIGFVGGTYTQDAAFMADALNQVLSTRPDTRLVLVGAFNREIEPLLEQPQAIMRTGPLEIGLVYHYLSACDVCWLPLGDSGANRGRWPLKLNDYMTVARPVISTDVGDLGQVITDEQMGVVTPADTGLFARATLSMLDDADRRTSLGQNGRRAAETRYSWENLAVELEDFYQQLLENGNRE